MSTEKLHSNVNSSEENETGKRVKSALLALGFRNVLEFSEKTGIKQSTVYAVIRGQIKKPGGSILGKFQDSGININWILTGEGEMFMPKLMMQEQAENTAGGAPVLGVKDRAPQPIGWREFNKALEGFLSGADENSVDLIIRRLHIWLEANRKD